MKRVLFIWFVLICVLGKSYSQTNENLARSVLASIDVNEVVRPGEFQMELLKGAFFNYETDNPWFSFIYTTTNKFTGDGRVVVNGHPRFNNGGMAVRTYKIGPTQNESIFVFKNNGVSNTSMGSGMELVMANGVTYPICDSVLYVNDDGYVYSQNGKCFYSRIKNSFDEEVKAEPVVWLERKYYDHNREFVDPNKAEAFARLSDGDVFYESSEGHFYYLFRDKYMPYTVLVVDNLAVELFDVYDEDELRFKFSYNGRHWMAVGKELFWVDGVMKSLEGYDISDFLVTDDGHYAYKASEKGGVKNREVVVYDGDIIRRNADVCYFGLNSEGNLKIRFVTGDRYLQYENENVTDVTSSLVSVYYPEEDRDRTVQVLSDDGLHRLTYCHSVASVEIDGVKVTDSAPCYAVFDSRNHLFVWNAIETNGLRTELVIYRFSVPKNILKKILK